MGGASMRSPLRGIALLTVAAGVVVAVSLEVRSGSSPGGRDSDGTHSAVARDGTVHGAQGRKAPQRASGTVEGTLVRIASKRPGRVLRVLGREGERVTA